MIGSWGGNQTKFAIARVEPTAIRGGAGTARPNSAQTNLKGDEPSPPRQTSAQGGRSAGARRSLLLPAFGFGQFAIQGGQTDAQHAGRAFFIAAGLG